VGKPGVKLRNGAAALIRFATGEEGVLHGGEEPAAASSRASGGRKQPGSLAGWAHLSVRWRLRQTGPEREGGDGPRLGWKRREEVGRGWAGKEGRRSGRNHCSGLKSKRVKENQF
jgi:hypothetical protein